MQAAKSNGKQTKPISIALISHRRCIVPQWLYRVYPPMLIPHDTNRRVFREEDVVQAPITNRRDKHQSAVHFLLASTHLRALTNASTQGVIWSLFTRSAG